MALAALMAKWSGLPPVFVKRVTEFYCVKQHLSKRSPDGRSDIRAKIALQFPAYRFAHAGYMTLTPRSALPA